MKKEYIRPQIKERQICAHRFMTGSQDSPTIIEKGEYLNGKETEGIYV